MNQERVQQRFAFLTRLSAEEVEEWSLLCNDAAAQLQSQCRKEVDDADSQELLCAAAAALAFYRYTLLSEMDGQEDVTLGDIRITRKQGTASTAKQLWEDAHAQVADLLQDRDFLFERIGVEHEPS